MSRRGIDLTLILMWLSLYIWACVFETQIHTVKSIGKQACRIPKKKSKTMEWFGASLILSLK